jgi:hypothetical protein
MAQAKRERFSAPIERTVIGEVRALRPFLRTMQNTGDFDNFPADMINDKEWYARNYKLTSARFASQTAKMRKLLKRAHRLVHTQCQLSCRFRSVVFLDVIADVREITRGGSVHRMRISQDTGG